MLAEKFDTKPVEALLQKHALHTKPYTVDFMGQQYVILPEVFNPTYTKVSGFLARNIEVEAGQNILEMFCGSGAVGLSAVKNAKKLVGVDISPQAIKCSKKNAQKRKASSKSEFRNGNLWQVIKPNEKFDVILANPPLLPAIPENWLEMAVADSPEMTLTSTFISGLKQHLTKNGHALMAFSNACSVYVGDPMAYIAEQAKLSGVNYSIQDEWDVGYEVYRIIRFTK